MVKNQTKQHSNETQGLLNKQADARDLATNLASNTLSRRSFLGRVSASTAVAAATSVGLPSLLLSEKAKAADDGDGSSRRSRSYRIRVSAALAERNVRTPRQISNGDEDRYDNFIGNYSQGLPHNSIGEVDPTAYQALLTAVTSGSPSRRTPSIP